jgi:hypothetical protein
VHGCSEQECRAETVRALESHARVALPRWRWIGREEAAARRQSDAKQLINAARRYGVSIQEDHPCARLKRLDKGEEHGQLRHPLAQPTALWHDRRGSKQIHLDACSRHLPQVHAVAQHAAHSCGIALGVQKDDGGGTTRVVVVQHLERQLHELQWDPWHAAVVLVTAHAAGLARPAVFAVQAPHEGVVDARECEHTAKRSDEEQHDERPRRHLGGQARVRRSVRGRVRPARPSDGPGQAGAATTGTAAAADAPRDKDSCRRR